MSEDFTNLIEQSISKLQVKQGSIINATVIDIKKDLVIVNAGLKSEGMIPIDQFINYQGDLEVKEGDVVEVSLDAIEDGFGETKLSREKAKKAKAWVKMEEAFEKKEILSGRITGKVKGGFTIEMQDAKAFLPGSLVDVRPVRDTGYLEGKDLEFVVIKIDKKRNNVVVSRKAVMEMENSEERDEFISNLEEGSVVKGIVKNITDYGAFLDLGGVDGLLHITDMAWKRVKHPSELIKVGDEIDVKVLKFDKDKTRVSLGLKQLNEDPWFEISNAHPIGSIISGKITNIADYGCFVEIQNGIEGLVHVSEMDWANKNANPEKLVSLGQEINVKILDIDPERRRISLGIKQCEKNPWVEFINNHKTGEHIKGEIKSITDFGVFIGLENGIDGLVHLSDLSWTIPGEEAVKKYKKGDQLETILLSADPERERISLGVKQLTDNPFADFMDKNPKNSVMQLVVKEKDEKQLLLDVGGDISGVIKKEEFADIDQISKVQVGETLDLMVLNFDKKNQTVYFSQKALEQKNTSEVLDKIAKENEESKATLGDIIKDQIDN
ncbi:MAG: 30S ribosomal protein S1 [Gammaproteobacteria bacterium]|nr:30S ribosomal protein S1 [Gammaproteobacteria bacterium]